MGGPWSYQEFPAAKADHTHERYAEFGEWIDPDAFDPNLVDGQFHAHAVEAFAKKWDRKTAVKKMRLT